MSQTPPRGEPEARSAGRTPAVPGRARWAHPDGGALAPAVPPRGGRTGDLLRSAVIAGGATRSHLV
ncbi:hypothetical protein ACIA8O_35405 [Kitasatospora sp. NPDC051853]|uniref:hypothetical protein n=1 Tax=Kitasatospora sp. NPDC051853 TaxID=3364058 RepID=UPI00379BB135